MLESQEAQTSKQASHDDDRCSITGLLIHTETIQRLDALAYRETGWSVREH